MNRWMGRGSCRALFSRAAKKSGLRRNVAPPRFMESLNFQKQAAANGPAAFFSSRFGNRAATPSQLEGEFQFGFELQSLSIISLRQISFRGNAFTRVSSASAQHFRRKMRSYPRREVFFAPDTIGDDASRLVFPDWNDRFGASLSVHLYRATIPPIPLHPAFIHPVGISVANEQP